ncbi:MAG: hypothetical protein ACI4JB_11485 [Porcipelethomonas sp.]
MAHFISDHTPMDDYQRMLRQAKHYIEGVDDNNRLPYDNREKLNKSPVYKFVFNTMKSMLIIAGLSLLAAIIALLAYKIISSSNTLKFIGICCFIMAVGSFVLALLIGCAGGYMESHSEKKDKKTRVIRNSETWILTNGCVAVVAEKRNGQGYQMVKRLVTDKDNIVDLPFSRMDIIDKVYSIRNKNGKVTAYVNVTEYYMTHPYVNEYPDDDENLSLYFHYYKKRKRRKIEWNENMLGIDKLIKALNELKHRSVFK